MESIVRSVRTLTSLRSSRSSQCSERLHSFTYKDVHNHGSTVSHAQILSSTDGSGKPGAEEFDMEPFPQPNQIMVTKTIAQADTPAEDMV